MIFSKRLLIAFILGLVFAVIADFLLQATAQLKAEVWGSEFVGYWAAFGFVWYLIIVAFSKLLGRYWLERPEDYYDGEYQGSDE